MEFSLLYFELRIRYNHYSLQITLNHPSHIGDNLSLIGSANDSSARNNPIGTGLGTTIDSLGSDASIDFDIKVGIVLAQPLDLGHHVSHKRLPTKARLYSHDQHQICYIDILLQILHLFV